MASVVLRGGLLLLARRAPGGELGGLWELPGGKLEPGETDEQALIREFDEEFGARLEPLALMGETSFEHRGRRRSLAAWACRLGEDSALRLTEHLESRWLSPEDAETLDLVDSDRKLLPVIRAWIEASSGPHS